VPDPSHQSSSSRRRALGRQRGATRPGGPSLVLDTLSPLIEGGLPPPSRPSAETPPPFHFAPQGRKNPAPCPPSSRRVCPLRLGHRPGHLPRSASLHRGESRAHTSSPSSRGDRSKRAKRALRGGFTHTKRAPEFGGPLLSRRCRSHRGTQHQAAQRPPAVRAQTGPDGPVSEVALHRILQRLNRAMCPGPPSRSPGCLRLGHVEHGSLLS
jgi:hypothetical protein